MEAGGPVVADGVLRVASRPQGQEVKPLLEINICTWSLLSCQALAWALDIKYLIGIRQSREIWDEFVLGDNLFTEDLT